MSFRQCTIRFPKPLPNPGKINGTGPIVGFEVMHGTHADGERDFIWWAITEEATAYKTLAEMCEECGMDLESVAKLLAIALIGAEHGQ